MCQHALYLDLPTPVNNSTSPHLLHYSTHTRARAHISLTAIFSAKSQLTVYPLSSLFLHLFQICTSSHDRPKLFILSLAPSHHVFLGCPSVQVLHHVFLAQPLCVSSSPRLSCTSPLCICASSSPCLPCTSSLCKFFTMSFLHVPSVQVLHHVFLARPLCASVQVLHHVFLAHPLCASSSPCLPCTSPLCKLFTLSFLHISSVQVLHHVFLARPLCVSSLPCLPWTSPLCKFFTMSALHIPSVQVLHHVFL